MNLDVEWTYSKLEVPDKAEEGAHLFLHLYRRVSEYRGYEYGNRLRAFLTEFFGPKHERWRMTSGTIDFKLPVEAGSFMWQSHSVRKYEYRIRFANREDAMMFRLRWED